jgi:hypothetical protein
MAAKYDLYESWNVYGSIHSEEPIVAHLKFLSLDEQYYKTTERSKNKIRTVEE